MGNGRAGPRARADSLGLLGGVLRGVGRGKGHCLTFPPWGHRVMRAPGTPLMRGKPFAATERALHCVVLCRTVEEGEARCDRDVPDAANTQVARPA